MTATAKPLDLKRQTIINNPYAPPDWHWPIDRSTHAFPPALERCHRTRHITRSPATAQAKGKPGPPNTTGMPMHWRRLQENREQRMKGYKAGQETQTDTQKESRNKE